MVPSDKKVTHKRVEIFDVGGGTLHFGRGDMTLCKKQAELQTLPKLIATQWKGRYLECVWGIYLSPPCREQLCVPKESSFPILWKDIDVLRQTTTTLDILGENSVDDVWNIVGHRILSDSWSGSTRFHILNKRPPQGYSWVDGGWTITQVTSRPEKDLARSVVVYVLLSSKESKAALGYGKQNTENSLHSSDEVEEFDAIIQYMEGESWTFLWSQRCRAARQDAVSQLDGEGHRA